MNQNDDLHDDIDQLARQIETRIQSNEAFLAEVEFDPTPHGLQRLKEAIFG